MGARRLRTLRGSAGWLGGLALVLALVMGACGEQAPTAQAPPVVQQPAAQTQPPTAPPQQAVTQAPTSAQAATPAQASPPAQPAPGPQGLDLVALATVQIVSQGTFVDPQLGTVQNVAGSGSGFIISEDGLVVTANHVVTGAATLNVYVPGRSKPVNARIVGASECADLAVIDLAGGGYPFIQFAERQPPVGTPIYVAGYPLGEPEYALVAGIIAKADAPGDSSWASVDHSLQHDALANPGNSGGPVVTEDGQVVGIHYASRPAVRQSFAIGLDQAMPILDILLQGRNLEWIGINGTAVVGPGVSGIWVASVASGSPADRAGVRPGDIVVEIERLALATNGTMSDYCDILRSRGPADVLQVKVLRFSTGQVLEGQINGRPLAALPPDERATVAA